MHLRSVRGVAIPSGSCGPAPQFNIACRHSWALACTGPNSMQAGRRKKLVMPYPSLIKNRQAPLSDLPLPPGQPMKGAGLRKPASAASNATSPSIRWEPQKKHFSGDTPCAKRSHLGLRACISCGIGPVSPGRTRNSDPSSPETNQPPQTPHFPASHSSGCMN